MSIKIKAIVVLAVIIVLPIVWYLISPIFKVVEVQEESPLQASSKQPVIKDAMNTMDAATKREFERQVMEASKKVKAMNEGMPSKTKFIAQGEFTPRAHDVAGRALLIQQGDKKILRFEDFETINGPRLNIYLSSELGDDDFVDLGLIRATKGNVNYELPAGVDTSRYNKVLVWCVTFGVLFSYAELR